MTKRDAADILREEGVDALRKRLDQDIWKQVQARRDLGLNDEEIAEEIGNGSDVGSGNSHAGNGHGGNGGPPLIEDFGRAEEPKVRRCDRCGYVNSIDATKCKSCGADIGAQPPPHPGVRADYMDSKPNGVRSNVGNIGLALRQEPTLMNAFAYDEMLRTEMLMRPLGINPNFKPRPLDDVDITKVQMWLQW